MRRALIAVAIAGAVAALLFVAYAHRARIERTVRHLSGGAAQVISVGSAFPPVDVIKPDRSPVYFAPARGRITFVNIFATWCPPCRAETPDLVKFAADASKRGIDVIGIDRAENASQVDAFRRQFGITYPYLIDDGRETKTVLGARAMPTTIVVDAKGIVRANINGPLTYDQLETLAAQAGS